MGQHTAMLTSFLQWMLKLKAAIVIGNYCPKCVVSSPGSLCILFVGSSKCLSEPEDIWITYLGHYP